MGCPCLERGAPVQFIDLLNLLADLSGTVNHLSEFLTSDSHFKLGIVLIGLVNQKKKISNRFQNQYNTLLV
jgi:hypothetical protein